MGTYIKTMVVVAVMAVAVMLVGFKFSVEVSTQSVQANLDERAKDAASLTAIALKDYDELEDMEKVISEAFALDSFETISLYDAQGQIRIQKKKEINTENLAEGMISLKAKEVSADITNRGMPNGKIVVKGDVREAYKNVEAKVQELMNLFLLLGIGSIVVLAIVIKLFMRTPKSA